VSEVADPAARPGSAPVADRGDHVAIILLVLWPTGNGAVQIDDVQAGARPASPMPRISTGLSENTVACSCRPASGARSGPSFQVNSAGMMSTVVLDPQGRCNQGRQRTKLERSCRPADWLLSQGGTVPQNIIRATAQVKGTHDAGRCGERAVRGRPDSSCARNRSGSCR